jgi:hypothetical protein
VGTPDLTSRIVQLRASFTGVNENILGNLKREAKEQEQGTRIFDDMILKLGVCPYYLPRISWEIPLFILYHSILFSSLCERKNVTLEGDYDFCL